MATIFVGVSSRWKSHRAFLNDIIIPTEPTTRNLVCYIYFCVVGLDLVILLFLFCFDLFPREQLKGKSKDKKPMFDKTKQLTLRRTIITQTFRTDHRKVVLYDYLETQEELPIRFQDQS